MHELKHIVNRVLVMNSRLENAKLRRSIDLDMRSILVIEGQPPRYSDQQVVPQNISYRDVPR